MATSYRHGLGSPPKYRHSTMDISHSLETGQHTPITSALDRKWVHRSVGDLTSDNDLQLTHPRLASKFYQDLYQKYPRAFQRRREARDAGRKLFNPKPHVKFDDEIVDDMSLKSYRSERPTTNWDREVGHFKNARSRDCVTSLEPSETGSVLSVKERLHLNSQTLNRLLNEKSPLRKRFSEESNLQYPHESSPTDENSIRDVLFSNRTRPRFRHRKVLQRKVDNKQNSAVNGHLGELRKPHSLSKQYARRAKTVSPTNSKHKHVDVEALLANADLEINTLLEKFSAKMSGPESPPDSAIDVDTPSLRSLATTERGSNSDLPLSVPHDIYGLHDLDTNARTVESCDGADNLYVDTVGSVVKTKYKSEELMDPLKDPDNILLLKEYDMHFDDIQLPKNIEIQRTSTDNQVNSNLQSVMEKRSEKDIYPTDINGAAVDLVHSVMKSNHEESESGLGLGMLQSNNIKSSYHKKEDGPSPNSENTDIIKCVEYSNDDLDLCSRADRTNGHSEVNGENTRNVQLNSAIETDAEQNVDNCNIKQVLASTLADLNQDRNYQADDEAEVNEKVVPKMHVATAGSSRKMPLHRDSDVDSGIGQSGTETKSPLPVPPPRGRSRQRGAASKTQPVRANHSILPLRSEVDTCILNEVDLTRLSHDLSHDHRRPGSHCDMVDDTDPTRESVIILSEEQKLTEKYRRQRSPSPYVLKASRAASPRFRAQSAPIYYSGQLDLHVVDISLSNESLSDISSGVSVSSTLNNVSISGIDSFNVSNLNPPQSVHNEMSCQTDKQSSSKNLQQPCSLTSNLNNVELQQADSNVKSSSPVEQRKSSSSTYSVTSVSSVDTVTTLNNVHVNDIEGGNLKDDNERNGDDKEDKDKRNSSADHAAQNNDVISVEMDIECRKDEHESAVHSAHYKSQNKISNDKGELESNDEIGDKEYSAISQTIEKENLGSERLSSTENLSYNQSECLNQNTPDNHEIVEQSSIPNEHNSTKDNNQVRSSVNENIRSPDDLGLYSARKIDIVKPKFETQSSVESRESFETVELNSDPEVTTTHGSQVKEIGRIYKPSVNSPRVNEKRTNMRNIFKHKKGRLSPGIEQTVHKENQEIVLIGCDKANPEQLKTQGSSSRHVPDSLHNSNSDSLESEEHNDRVRIKENEEILMNGISHPTYSARPIVIDPECQNPMRNGQSPHEQHLSRLKTNLRAELNLSKYKIRSDQKTGSDQTSEIRLDQLSQSSGSHWSQDSQRSHESSRSQGTSSPRSHGSQRSNNREAEEQAAKNIPGTQQNDGNKQRSKSDDTEIHVEESNLQKSKGMSASKGSLLDKMGGLKIATKGKFKAMRKAMSLERGIDQAGNHPQDHQSKPDNKGGHSFFPKMKKAPSLKSFTGLFGRKKKKGKYSAEEVEASSSGSVPSGSADNTASLSNDKRKQWASCHTLSSLEVPPDSQGIGRLIRMNPDGTQIVELKRPANGHLGFFIAVGNPKYKKGVFVSRFSKEGPENRLAGLIGVGDEILEVNRHLVHNLSLDAVYKLMGASPTITLKIFPLIARKDI